MTFLEAAARILAREGGPLHYREIVRRALEQDLLSHVGKTPELAMRTRLSAAVRRDPKGTPFVRTGPGIYTLRPGASDAAESVVRQADESRGRPAPPASSSESEARARSSVSEAKDRPQRTAAAQAAAGAVEGAPAPAPKPDRATAKARETGAALPSSAPAKAPAETPEGRRGEPLGGERQGRREAAQKPAKEETEAADARGARGGAAERGTGAAPSGDDREVRPRSTRRSRPSRRGRDETAREQSASRGGSEGAEEAALKQEGASKSRRRRKRRRGRAQAAESVDVVTALTRILDARGAAVPIGELVHQLQAQLRDDAANPRERLLAHLHAANMLDRARGRTPRFVIGLSTVDLTARAVGPAIAEAERRVRVERQRLEDLTRGALAERLRELELPGLLAIVEVCLEIDGWKTIRQPTLEGDGSAALICRHAGAGQDVLAVVVASRGLAPSEHATRLSTLRGSLHELEATRGLFISATEVEESVRRAAHAPGAPFVDVWDGAEVARRMYSAGLGVSVTTFAVSTPDPEFFVGLGR